MRWIFAQRLAGASAAGIARTLNHLGAPPPSGHDRVRNPHRAGEAWTLRAVAEILANPRYTGRQVWNRQYTDHQETNPGDRRTSRGAVRRWNPKDRWVISTRLAHPPLVSEADFSAAQAVTAVATPKDGRPRRYLLTGLVTCRFCDRTMEAHWVHGRPGYRCRHGRTSAGAPQPGHPKALYLREDVLLARIAAQLPDRDFDTASVGRAVAACLRINQITVICDREIVNLDSHLPAARTPLPQQRPSPEPLER